MNGHWKNSSFVNRGSTNYRGTFPLCPVMDSRSVKTTDFSSKNCEVETFWKPFTRAFQLLCVSHFSIYRAKIHGYLFLIYFLIVSTIHISLLAFDVNKGMNKENNHSHHPEHKDSPLMLYVNCLSIFGRFATHMITHFETLLNGACEREIHRKLKKINIIFTSKLNYLVDYKAKRTKYIQKTVSVFAFATLLTVASSLVNAPLSNHDKYFSKTIFICAVIIVRFRGCHIAPFLNIIADALNDLQVLLMKHQMKCHQRRLNDKRENIRYLREIYSNIWLVKKMLSDCFGWSLIIFLIEFSIEFINSSYWFYINLNSYGSIYSNVRKIQISL